MSGALHANGIRMCRLHRKSWDELNQFCHPGVKQIMSIEKEINPVDAQWSVMISEAHCFSLLRRRALHRGGTFPDDLPALQNLGVDDPVRMIGIMVKEDEMFYLAFYTQPDRLLPGGVPPAFFRLVFAVAVLGVVDEQVRSLDEEPERVTVEGNMAEAFPGSGKEFIVGHVDNFSVITAEGIGKGHARVVGAQDRKADPVDCVSRRGYLPEPDVRGEGA